MLHLLHMPPSANITERILVDNAAATVEVRPVVGWVGGPLFEHDVVTLMLHFAIREPITGDDIDNTQHFVLTTVQARALASALSAWADKLASPNLGEAIH